VRFVPALLMSLLISCDGSGEKPQVVFMADMLESIPYDDYDPHPDTAAGQTLMLPPEGTVPIGFVPFDYGTGDDEALRAGQELQNPLEATPDELARGRHVYETMCLVCHGVGGEGDGPIIGRFPNPPSLLAERAMTFPDGRIYHIITRGQGIMPSHAVQVRPPDRWRVILHVRRLQQGAGE